VPCRRCGSSRHTWTLAAIVVLVKLRETPATRATIADFQALKTVRAVDPS